MSIRETIDSNVKRITKFDQDNHVSSWIIYLIPLTVLIFGFIFPLITMIINSVYPNISGAADTGFTLEFYQSAFDTIYIVPLFRSILYGILTTLACLVLGYPLVYAAVKIFPRYEVSILLLAILPFWVMYIIRMFGWIAILESGGLIHEFISIFGIGYQPSLLYNSFSVVIGLIFSWLPLMVIPLYDSIKQLNPDQIEAAKDLGSNSYRAFRRVTIPQTFSGIVAGSVLVFVPSFGSYVTPILLGGPSSSQMIASVIGRQFSESFNWGLGSALATLTIIIVFISVIFVERYSTIIEVSDNE